MFFFSNRCQSRVALDDDETIFWDLSFPDDEGFVFFQRVELRFQNLTWHLPKGLLPPKGTNHCVSDAMLVFGGIVFSLLGLVGR